MSLLDWLKKAFHRHEWTKPRPVVGYSNHYVRCLKCPKVMIEVGRPCGGDVAGLGTEWIPPEDWRGKFDRKANLKAELEKAELRDYENLEKAAIESARDQTNIARIADELNGVGFAASISSRGGKDASDLELKVRRKVKENEC